MVLATVRLRPSWRGSLRPGVLSKDDEGIRFWPVGFTWFTRTISGRADDSKATSNASPACTNRSRQRKSDCSGGSGKYTVEETSDTEGRIPSKDGFLATAGFNDVIVDNDGDRLRPPPLGVEPWDDRSFIFQRANASTGEANGTPPNNRRAPPRRRQLLKSPSQVAMEEFAALERRLAGGSSGTAEKPVTANIPSDGKATNKTPEQVAMEEFTALERKISGARGATTMYESKAKRKERLSKLRERPKVSLSYEFTGTRAIQRALLADY